jgi:hypothetical protein
MGDEDSVARFGIYSITFPNDPDDKLYIGSTWDSFRRRWRDHLNAMVKGKHKNHYLQGLYNRHGTPTFSILEVCEHKDLVRVAEKYHMDMNRSSGRLVNLEDDPVNHKMSKETRKKLGKSMSEAKYKRGKQYTKINRG